MDLVGADVFWQDIRGQVMQYFSDVDRVLVQTPDGLHHLVSPQDIRVAGDDGVDRDLDELHAGQRAEEEWLERYSAPSRRIGAGLLLGVSGPDTNAQSSRQPSPRKPAPAEPLPRSSSLEHPVDPRPPRASHPDYSWYRDGFVRTDAIAERCAISVQRWVSSNAARASGLLAVTVVAGERLAELLPQPALRGSSGWGRTAADMSVKVSLITHPASMRRALLTPHGPPEASLVQSQSAATRAGYSESARRQRGSPSLAAGKPRPVSALGRSSAASNPSRSDAAGSAGALRIPTSVNPLMCRRLPLFETSPVTVVGAPMGDSRAGSARCEFSTSARGIGMPSAPANVRLQRRVCIIKPTGLVQLDASAGAMSAATPPPLPASASITTPAPVLNWTCLESYLHFQVSMNLGTAEASAASPAYQLPQQQRVVGHAIVRVCDILAGAVREYGPGSSALYDALQQDAGDSVSRSPRPLEFFVRLVVPLTPLHDDAPASGAESAVSSGLDIELSLVLPPGVTLEQEHTQAYSRPPPVPATTPGMQKLGAAHTPMFSGADEGSDGDDDDIARQILMQVSDHSEVLPDDDTLEQQQQRPGSNGIVGSRWALGPGKAAREQRLAKALAAYSNVRGALPPSPPRVAAKGFAAPAPVTGSSVPSALSAEDAAAAAEAARTAALIRSSVAELQHSIEGIQAQLQMQTDQMNEVSAKLSRGGTIAAQLKAGLYSSVARLQQQPQPALPTQPLVKGVAAASMKSAPPSGSTVTSSRPRSALQTTLTLPPHKNVVGGLMAASAHLYSEHSHVAHALAGGGSPLPHHAGGMRGEAPPRGLGVSTRPGSAKH